MDLWQGALRDFVRSAESGAIAGDMTGQFVKCHGAVPAGAEVRSWENSLAELARALRPLGTREVGVRVGSTAEPLVAESGPLAVSARAAPGAAQHVGVVTEYHLPLSGRRIDVMLCGFDTDRRAKALVVELKQWSSVSLEDELAVNVVVDGVEHAHPSQQALDYAGWLADYHSAFSSAEVSACAASFCHNLSESGAASLRDPRYSRLLGSSPLYVKGDQGLLLEHVAKSVGSGAGLDVLQRVTGGTFQPSKGVLEALEGVLMRDEQWHLLDAQRVAHGAVVAEVRRLARGRGHRIVLVRGGPGTGKSVIAVQLLADALRLGLKAAHSTGGKAFTTALRSKFRGADRLFLWNMNLRSADTQTLDLLLVDEAHRIRKTSDIQWTPSARRGGRSQVRELIESAKVSVFLLDENQFVRPDEIGTTTLIRNEARAMGIRLREFDLSAQFRCGGCEEYVAWVDHLLGFSADARGTWRSRYTFRLVGHPEELQGLLSTSVANGERARIVAGFCWEWSDAAPGGALVPDVKIGDWQMPWNRKRDKKKRYRPSDDPYTLWAETTEGLGQVGCIYSAQGFEFDRVGVVWGPDLVWRAGKWIAVRAGSKDRPVRSAGDEMLRLVRNAYRVLLTRGTRETTLLCLDEETRRHVEEMLGGTR